MELIDLSCSDFEKFVSKQPCNNFLQSPEMASRYEKKHIEHYLLGLKFNNNIEVAALVRASTSRFGKIFKISGGPILNYNSKNAQKLLESFTALISDFLKEKGGIALQISPNISASSSIKSYFCSLKYKYLGEYESAKWIYIIPTKDKDPNVMFKDFRRNHQRLIRRAEKSNLSIRELKPSELKILKSIAAAAGERHGFKDPDLSYYKEMKNAFKDKVSFKVCELTQDEKTIPIMAGMFIYYGDEIVCPYSGSLKEYQRYGGAHFMHWTIIQEAIKKNVSRYNLYGTHKNPENGVYQFKLGFNGQSEELLGTFLLPLTFSGKILSLTKTTKEEREVR